MRTSIRTGVFSGGSVEAAFVERPQDHHIDGRAIVVNLGPNPVTVHATPTARIPAFSSTILIDACIAQGDAILVMTIPRDDAIHRIVDEPGWHRLADIATDFPDDIPLHRGPRRSIGTVLFDPGLVLGETTASGPRAFRVSINLWFAPAGTDCAIHDTHGFIETHTQIHGLGRMQKFRKRDYATLYEEQLMSPGMTQSTPFCRLGPAGGFVYPWHQYRADSDCVWLAVEYETG